MRLSYNLHFWFSKDLQKYLSGFCNEFDKRVCRNKFYVRECCEYGYLKLFKCHPYSANNFDLLRIATRNGHLNIVMHIRHAIMKNVNTQICSEAAESNQLEVLKWARENGGRLPRVSVRIAALKGHLSILQWIMERGGLEFIREALEGIQIEDVDNRLKIEKLVWPEKTK